MSVRTRCPSGAGRRLSAGISRATGILQRRLCGHGIILNRRRLTGNGALLGQPGAEVDQPAALAAEWAKRGALPVQLTVAGGAVDAHRTHRLDPQPQQLSVKVTSVWAWVGRAVSPFQVRKRMLQR